MSQSQFISASKHPFKFSEARRQEMRDVLKLLPAGPGLDYDKFIDDIEQNRTFAMFGYGSLIGTPSGEIDKQSRGHVKGWEKGCFSKDRHYRGTPDKLAVTMGALQTEDGEGILEGVHKKLLQNPVKRQIALPRVSFTA